MNLFSFESLLLPNTPQTREGAIPIFCCTPEKLENLRLSLPERDARWLKEQGFEGNGGQVCCIPTDGGAFKSVFFGLGALQVQDPFFLAQLVRFLPRTGSVYYFSDHLEDPFLVALGWLLEGYTYNRYRSARPSAPVLICPEHVDRGRVFLEAQSAFIARDLVNTPANDLGPQELQDFVQDLACHFKADFSVIEGKALRDGFPMIFTVGQGSARAPRLLDVRWGNKASPKVTLVGKGVCFDTGGLNIKPEGGMLLMKKDMGGAACVLGLAFYIMSLQLDVCLRILIPAVENSISGDAFRPGDVLRSRKGLTVEIGNTDAEGRLVLADALAYADEEEPDLLIDMATLTGAARVALGPEIPPFYTDNDTLASEIAQIGIVIGDPVWRLPLWPSYLSLFESKIADMTNSGTTSFAGSIVAALFLKRFVEKSRDYLHFDVFAWNPAARNGRPQGGEAQAIRTLAAYLIKRYA